MATSTATRKTSTRTRKIAAKTEAPVVMVETPKPKRTRRADMPVDGCSAVTDGFVHACTEHKTYASDPHCRNRECASDIRRCDVHVLEKGGKVTVVAPHAA